MNFGKMPLANAFLSKDQFSKEFFFDMKVGFSEKLSLFQLNDHPSPKQMFNKNYPFFTGSSDYMKEHFKKYANWIKENYVDNSSKIIEIGSNDGTLLKNFKDSNFIHCGFEPSKNIANFSKKNGINVISDFFNYKNVLNLKKYIHLVIMKKIYQI